MIPLVGFCLLSLGFIIALDRVRDFHSKELERAKTSCRDSRAILDAADDALIVLDGSGHVLDLNAKAMEIFGMDSREEAKTKRLCDFSILKEEMAPVFQQYFDRALTGEAASFQWETIELDGKSIKVEAILSQLEGQAGRELLATIRDLSDHIQLEKERNAIQAQLFQVQKLDAMSQLAGGFAHDFNNSLTGIMGSISVLKMMNEAEEPIDRKETAEYLNAALDACLRAGDLIRQLQTISRKEATKLVAADVNELLNHTLQICGYSFPKSINIEFTPKKKPLMVLGDPAQLEQAILNVCINAFHAMTIMRAEGEREGGVLRVSIEETMPDIRMPGLFPVLNPDTRFLRISVADTGVGMDKEGQKRVFEPFFSTKEERQGAGLGLAIVYSIMKQHSGSVDMRSEPGVGTTVELYLPLMPLAGQSKSPHDSQIIPGEGTILIIDDEGAVRMSAEGMLRICGYKTLVADSGPAGIELYKAHQADIGMVLLDVSMPGMSGLEVIGHIKDLDPQAVVVMMSGYVENERINQAISSGAKAFLKKPFSLNSLAQTVKALISEANKP